MTLRIAVDARPLALPMVGITRYTFELLKRLIVDSPYEWFLYLDRPLAHALPDLPNVHIRAGRCRRSATSTVFAQWYFPRWAKQDKVDIFWSPRHHLPLLLPANIKTIVTIHDLVWHYYPETMSTLGRYLEKALMPPSVKRADKIISVSKATSISLAEVLSVDTQSLQVIPLASHFSTEHTSPATDSPKDYFLFVGTLEPRKNLQRLLQAFAAALAEDLSITTLKIVGGGGWGGIDIKELVQQYGLENHVQVLGRVDNQQLAQLYQQAYALVMPSLYEGFGLPLLEAMSFGVPVISSSVSSMPEVVGDGGILVDPMDVNEIADALLRIASDQLLYSELVTKANKQSSLFSWDIASAATLAVINDV